MVNNYKLKKTDYIHVTIAFLFLFGVMVAANKRITVWAVFFPLLYVAIFIYVFKRTRKKEK
jgi:hypothetical protein